MKNQTHLHLGWPEYFFVAKFHFWMNYSFNEIKGHSARLAESYCGLISEAKKTYMITLHKAASVPQSPRRHQRQGEIDPLSEMTPSNNQ